MKGAWKVRVVCGAMACLSLAGCLRSERECAVDQDCVGGEQCVASRCEPRVATGRDAGTDASREPDAPDAPDVVAPTCDEGEVACAAGCCLPAATPRAGLLAAQGDAGNTPSLAFDRSGNPHLAFTHKTAEGEERLYILWWNGEEWREDRPSPGEPYVQSGRGPELMFDAAGDTHVVHMCQTTDADVLMSSRLTGGAWVHDVIHAGDAPRAWAAAATPRGDTIGVVYALPVVVNQEDRPSMMRYAWKDGDGPWLTDTRVAQGGIISDLSVAFDQGEPLLLHMSQGVNAWAAGLYEQRRVDRVGWNGPIKVFRAEDKELGSESAVEVGPDGVAHGLVWEPTARYLQHVTSNGGEWQRGQTLNQSANLEQFDLAVDALGRPHVVYARQSGGISNLVYTTLRGGAWEDEEFDLPGRPTHPTIALDSEGHPHVAYYEDEGRSLLYLYYDGDAWVTR
jgi:hypothetical protein